VTYQRPEYILRDISSLEYEIPEEISLECTEAFPEGDQDTLILCEEHLVASDAYWDAVGVISEYESLDIYSDGLNFDERPATYLLFK